MSMTNAQVMKKSCLCGEVIIPNNLVLLFGASKKREREGEGEEGREGEIDQTRKHECLPSQNAWLIKDV